MKFAIQCRGDQDSKEIKSKLKSYLTQFKMEYNEEEPDLCISVGGDGTLLEAFHRYVHRLDQTAFIGIHTGHLGFYADWVPDELEKLIIEIARTPFQVVEYPLLELTIRPNDYDEEHTYIALNEITVKTSEGSVVVDVEIKGEHFETFRGDGLCISTPSGSTAYNKALGGAIIHPSLEAIQITEMASINNRVFRTVGSPLILPKHHTAILRPKNERTFMITIDHLNMAFNDVHTIQCRVAKERVRFARFRPFPFWKRVHDSFISDSRSELS
ncbi:NAD kinase [Piscibacillus salipiscarius]|uniref:NAD kinase n=1 Tax=Piscibacillus salipiscarius TaxID=299480 RepID=A0ABW5QDP2_9BACI|nr:NAD kinase [Piscibacillus salipiscarius]